MTADRAERVQARLAEAGVDALLVTDLVNVRYLTGFTGSSGLCVLGEGIRRFVTDFRYVQQATQQVTGFAPERAPQELHAGLAEGWPAAGLRLGFEDHRLTVRQRVRLDELLPAGVELVAAGGLVERERAVKAPEEVQRIAAAAGLADEALGELLAEGLAGRTERDVALALQDGFRRRGAEPSFPTIVASGPHGALPHASPRDVEIAPATLVTIDFGAQLDGYCSDSTRTYATPGELPDALAEIHALVLRAQLAGLDALRPGPTGRDVDAVARAIIAAGGHGEHFGHSLGHGVGLEVHEGPRIGTTGTEPLVAGNVVTVEPGVYVPGLGGARIEDLVVVTDDGARVLNGHAKDLTVVG